MISDAILNVGNSCQQSLAFYHTLLYPINRSVAKTTGLYSDVNEAMLFQWQQLKEMLAVAMSSTAKQKGLVNADEAAFVQTILMAVASDVTSKEAAPSV
jgi:CBS domain containing-hemolysin-like protein